MKKGGIRWDKEGKKGKQGKKKTNKEGERGKTDREIEEERKRNKRGIFLGFSMAEEEKSIHASQATCGYQNLGVSLNSTR